MLKLSYQYHPFPSYVNHGAVGNCAHLARRISHGCPWKLSGSKGLQSNQPSSKVSYLTQSLESRARLSIAQRCCADTRPGLPYASLTGDTTPSTTSSPCAASWSLATSEMQTMHASFLFLGFFRCLGFDCIHPVKMQANKIFFQATVSAGQHGGHPNRNPGCRCYCVWQPLLLPFNIIDD